MLSPGQGVSGRGTIHIISLHNNLFDREVTRVSSNILLAETKVYGVGLAEVGRKHRLDLPQELLENLFIQP